MSLRNMAALAAACVMSTASAQGEPADVGSSPHAPLIAYTAGPSPQFHFSAAVAPTDLSRYVGSGGLVERFGIQDPAAHMSAAIASAIAIRKKGRIADSPIGSGERALGNSGAPGQAPDYTVDVTTLEWEGGYFLDLGWYYGVRYAARVRVTTSDGVVLRSADCDIMPGDQPSAESNEKLLAHNATVMKDKLAIAAKDCLKELLHKTRDV